MRHHNVNRKFGREMNQRKALMRSLAYSLVVKEKIKTTEPKAKELRPFVEKLITFGKKGTLASRRELETRVGKIAGKKIALLWGYLFRGEDVFGVLEKALKARYPGVEFVNWREFGSTHGNKEHEVVASLPKRFKELGVDGAISGMGC
mgnify:CR=1 FL=1